VKANPASQKVAEEKTGAKALAKAAAKKTEENMRKTRAAAVSPITDNKKTPPPLKTTPTRATTIAKQGEVYKKLRSS